MKIIAPLLLALLPLATFAATAVPERDIEAVFSDLRLLAPMKSGQRFTLPARGRNLTGIGDDFLRRRTADEIVQSGLSCGCGDYAQVFIARIEPRGYETLLVDSAQISFVSLASNFAGHVVVAMRPKGDIPAPWWLVDTTALRILSRDWSPGEKSFTASGSVYWIGYCGSIESYPVHSPDELKRFYLRTLATIPRAVLNHTLHRFEFIIDPSLKDDEGGYLNPNLPRLGREQAGILAQYHVEPDRVVPILLTAGENNSSGDLRFVDGRWLARVGLRSACSPSFLAYMEQKIRSHDDQAEAAGRN